MKIVKLIGLLCAVFVVNSVQSMELPTQYPLEKQLLLGEISAEQYLASQRSSHNAYQLVTAEYLDPNQSYYIDLIEVIETLQSQFKSMLVLSGLTENVLRQFREEIKLYINQYYDDLISAMLQDRQN